MPHHPYQIISSPSSQLKHPSSCYKTVSVSKRHCTTRFPRRQSSLAVVWTGGKLIPERDGVPGVEHFSDLSLTIGVDYRTDGNKADEDERLDRFVGMIKAGGGGL